MIKTLLKSVREYKKDSILAPLFMIGEVAMEVLIPFYMAKLINNGIEAQNMEYIVKIGVFLAILCIISLSCGVLSGKYAASAASGFSKNLRKDMYYNIQKFSFNNIDKFSTSSIITRLTTDVTNIQNAYQMIIRVAVRSPVMLFSSFSMAFYLNPKLSIIFLVAIIILGISLYIIIKNVYPIFQKIFKVYDKLNSVVQENLYGIRVVKSYVREDFEESKFKEVATDLFEKYVKTEKIVAFTNPLMNLVIYGALIGLAWFSAKYIIQGDMQTGELTTLITYSTQILISLMMLSMILVMLVMSKASAERIVEILKEETDIKNNNMAKTEVKSGDVSFRDVSFSYTNDKNKCCLIDINLDIKEGETVGIIGATGSSKSTLVQLIPRLYDTLSGTVYVGGEDVKNYDLEALRESVAMVLQKNTLFSGTIKENLRWGNESATDEEMERVCKLACAHDFIQEFENKYDTHIEQGGTNVSGGQRQRLCIARALLKKPKILILDDSTSAVDTKTDALIREAFKNEIPNTTKIIIAQRVSSIQHADKIIVMEEGKIDAIGTHQQLLKDNEIYMDIYRLQQKGGNENA
ncbi:ABC transporter ATP-binding protein [uncultured Tyzzerella sp.]|uniref:ABC transporter ATP-binding protein n=1 Tax=uncultured Tyzzerella sp. TaxID=2321398 RepID=UPI00294200D8|nr:ABC transporter ATP-binding protein [uncultured Tyzzerella sp.]